MKLGTSRQGLQDLISTRLDLMKNTTSNSEGASEVNPKLGVKFA